MKDLCVLVPAKDEQQVISNTIRSLLRAGVKEEDIYVVDDGSSDKTKQYAEFFGINVLYNERNIGKAHSIAKALWYFQLPQRYEYVALMDADSTVDPFCYERVKQAFKGKNVAMVCSRTRNHVHNWLTAYRCLVYWLANEIYRKGQFALGVITVVPGFAATYRSDVINKVTWDNDTVTEDMDTTVQVHKKKLGRIVFDNSAIAYTQDPQTLHDYIKQMMRWYTGAWQVAAKHNMWVGNSRIDWEFKFLLGEAIVFSVWEFFLPVLFLMRPIWAEWAWAMDASMVILTALVCAAVKRRWDVALYSFLFPFMRLVDCAIILRTFWKIVVRRQTVAAGSPRLAINFVICTAVDWTYEEGCGTMFKNQIQERGYMKAIKLLIAVALFLSMGTIASAQAVSANPANPNPVTPVSPTGIMNTFPGSMWFVLGDSSPVENSNIQFSGYAEQGMVVFRAGRFSRALWLSRHRSRYIRLRLEQQHKGIGGSQGQYRPSARNRVRRSRLYI